MNEEPCVVVRRQTEAVLLSFSCGKDSIASWLECRRHFRRIEPYYLYLVPDLEFVEISLKYYESFFSTRIARLPHPKLYAWIDGNFHQPPERAETNLAVGWEAPSYDDMEEMFRTYRGLPREAYTAIGVRASDSIQRRLGMRAHGGVNHQRAKFWPIANWSKQRLVDELVKAKVRLPIDYRLFGRSFDGLFAHYLEPIRAHFPRDYMRIQEFFPLIDVDRMRYEYATH